MGRSHILYEELHLLVLNVSKTVEMVVDYKNYNNNDEEVGMTDWTDEPISMQFTKKKKKKK